MSILIYGAYGYTGTLIARRAVAQGHDPILAGRDEQKLQRVASSLDCRARAVSLTERFRLRSALEDVTAVVHCAGPFVYTARPMVEACLDTGTHYLDITGEIEVFGALMDRDADAKEAGIVLLPGVGFDVVPTDCLATDLAETVSSPTDLEIAFVGRGGVSQGTLKSAVEQMGQEGRVRRNGQVVAVPPGWTSRTVDFGDHPRPVISIPWGDVVTAGHSTSIPNVTVYTYLPGVGRTLLRLSRYAQGLLSWTPLHTVLKRLVEQCVPNPSPETRKQGHTLVWASVRGEAGERTTARLRGPEAYTLTARTAVQAAAWVATEGVPSGYHTPSTALGSDFVFDVKGVERLTTD